MADYKIRIRHALYPKHQTARQQLDEFLNNAHLRQWRKFAPAWCKMHQKHLEEAVAREEAKETP